MLVEAVDVYRLVLLCRLFVLRMSWSVISLLSLDMRMLRFTSARMINALDLCVTSEFLLSNFDLLV